MIIVLAVLLGLCAAGFVLYPLYKEKPVLVGQRSERTRKAEKQATGEKTQATDREQAARNALQEVELDYQLGNISATDYNLLRERYMQRALIAMKTRYEREQELDSAIEDQLRQMREQAGHEDEK